MNTKMPDSIRIIATPGEQDTEDLIRNTCSQALQIAQKMWGLEPPKNCEIFVMTSWLGFIFRSAPWSWKILLALTIPLWAPRARRTWPYSAAWTQRYGRRVAIGVKPPRLLEQSDRSIGVRMFVEEKDMRLNVQHVTCHELIHTCSAHLHLPMWLNEGIATVSVDRYLGKATILQETLDVVREYQPKSPPPSYRQLSRMQGAAIVYHGSRSYWLTRLLEERHPGFLKILLSQRRSTEDINHELAKVLKIDTQSLWHKIDDILSGHFQTAANKT